MNEKIKILYIVPSLRLCNGVASYAMNYFKNIDKNKIQIDFLITTNNEKSPYFDEIQKQGGKIFYIPFANGKKIVQNIIKIKSFFKENANKYSIVHCHVLNSGAIYLHYAKKYGIKVRILHSHATQYADKFLNKIRNKIFAFFTKKNANVYFACSKLAGEFMFKNKKFEVINNAIDIKKFIFSKDNREKIRKLENIDKNDIIILNVARLAPQKNLLFLIDIFNEVVKKNNNYKLLLIGSGPLKGEIEKKIKQFKLNDKVLMKEKLTNVNEYMHASDIFVLPSLYEGLPVVGIEAQCSGLKCLFSDTITEEVQIIKNTKFLSIQNKEKWINEILEFENYEREDETESMIIAGYKIEEEAKKLEKLYEDLLINWRNK